MHLNLFYNISSPGCFEIQSQVNRKLTTPALTTFFFTNTQKHWYDKYLAIISISVKFTRILNVILGFCWNFKYLYIA